VVVLDAVVEQELGSVRAAFPPGSDASSRGLSDKIGELSVGLVEDVFLLLEGHVLWVLVAVAVEADLVACVSNCCHFFWEGVETVSWDEPGCLDVVFLEEFEKTGDPNGSGE